MIPKPTPVALDNRPGLEQLTRRTGRHALFKESMMRGLRSRHRPGVTGFATQSDADWSIALIDAWASVCDVLSFYGERISHESYLRTATELFSVEALAELIGYQLTPPTAAETHLAFMAEDDEDAHLLTLLPPGIGIKSIPGEGEQPQSFETVEDLRVKAAWNAMPVLGHWPQSLGRSDRGMFVDAQRTQLRPGARVVMLDGQGAPVADPVNGKLLRRVAEVRSVNAQVSFAALARDVATPALPDPASLLRPLPALGSILPTTSPAEMIAGLKTNRWDRALVLEASDELNLDLADLGRSLRAQPHVEQGLQPQVLTLACRFFGHNALTQRAETVLDPVPGKIWDQRGGIVDTSALPALGLGERELFLDRDYGDIAPGMLLVVRGFSGADMFEAWSHVLEAESVSLEAFGLSGEATRLVVPQDWNTVEGAEIDIGALYVRGSALFTLPAPVTLPDVPIAADVAGAEILLDKPDVDLAPGQFVFVTGERSDMPGVTASERVQIKEVEVNGTTGRLIVEPALSHPFQRASVTLNANTARATHGESLTQVLGSGDATKPFQSFTLKDSPLTYVSADTASGRAATLEVFVEGVKWHEVAAFDQAEAAFGCVDVIVNNAGIGLSAPFLKISELDWDRVMDTNLKGAFMVAQEGANRMNQQGKHGSIINVASVSGLRVTSHLSHYSASKAGLVQLTKSMALELATYGIRVNAICPGYILTDINREFFETEAGKRMIGRVPQKKLGEIDDLLGPLVLLASDASRYMTGSVLSVDGGHAVSSL